MGNYMPAPQYNAPQQNTPKKKKKFWKIAGGVAILSILVGSCGDDSPKIAEQETEITALKEELENTRNNLNTNIDKQKESKVVIDDLNRKNESLEKDLNKAKEDDSKDDKTIADLRAELSESQRTETYQSPATPSEPEAVVPKTSDPRAGQILTCKEVGHKTYPGDGLYRSDHDRDGNGVGCESY